MKQTAAVRPREESSTSLLWCVMGLLIPRATLLGALSPFGIALAACGGAANLPTLLCVGVGYLLATPTLLPLRYLAAVGLVAGGRWILDALPDGGRQPFVPPLLSFVACAASGMMGLVGGGVDGYRTLLILAEAVVAAGVSLLFDTAIRLFHRTRPALTISGQAAIVTVAAVAVSAAATIEDERVKESRDTLAGYGRYLAELREKDAATLEDTAERLLALEAGSDLESQQLIAAANATKDQAAALQKLYKDNPAVYEKSRERVLRHLILGYYNYDEAYNYCRLIGLDDSTSRRLAEAAAAERSGNVDRLESLFGKP